MRYLLLAKSTRRFCALSAATFLATQAMSPVALDAAQFYYAAFRDAETVTLPVTVALPEDWLEG